MSGLGRSRDDHATSSLRTIKFYRVDEPPENLWSSNIMRNTRILSTFASLLALGFMTNTALAQKTWVGGTSHDWGTGSNWSPTGVPISSDDVIIASSANYAELDANRTVASLLIQSGGDLRTAAHKLTVSDSSGLTIDSGGFLRVSAASGSVEPAGGTVTLNGEIQLQASSSAAFSVVNDTTFSGVGAVAGSHNSAVIAIASGKTLENKATIRGALHITDATSSGSFKNNGVIDANYDDSTNNVLLIDPSSLSLSKGEYKVSYDTGNSSADTVLRIDVANTAANNRDRFDVSSGTLQINADISTKGALIFTAGSIAVASGVTAEFSR